MPGLQDVPGTHYAYAYIPGQATAGTADTWPVFYAPANCTITSIDWVPAAAVTGDNTNYFSLAVQNKGTAGSGSTAVTSTKAYTTGTDSVAHDGEALTLSATAANLNVASGEVLALVRTVAASGLAQPDGLVRIGFKYR
jgi:hypothetical protein